MQFKAYADVPTDLTDTPIDDATLIAIAQITRCVAEIEHCLTCFIGMLTGLGEMHVRIMLGRSAYSARLVVAEQLAKARSDHALSAYNAVFDEQMRALIDCRNTVCHGTYLGTTNLGTLAFLIDQANFSIEDKFGQTVHTYSPIGLQDLGQGAQLVIPKIEKILKIEAWRGTRLQRGLQLHPKAQKSRQPSKGQQSPPRSSPE